MYTRRARVHLAGGAFEDQRRADARAALLAVLADVAAAIGTAAAVVIIAILLLAV
jgi:hypothetical protein